MKKFLRLTLSFLLLLTLSGCGASPTTDSNDKTVTFYLIRHGETIFNTKGMAQGWCDSPLTKQGINQAKALGKGLSDIDFASSYTSVSERAMDTANLVLEGKNLTPILSEDLKEMNFGTLEASDSKTLFGKSFKRLVEPDGWKDVDGESWSELANRVKKELDKAATDSKDGDNVLISTHGMSILGFAQEVAGDSDVYQKFDETNESGLENCSVTIFEWKNSKYTLKIINDVSYLKKGLEAE